MKRYDISAVLEATDIVALASEYTQLKKFGRQYRGKCPFHNEKTASFYVNPDKQVWYCHGACHTGGNAIKLLERAGMTFGAALRMLAERGGVPATDEKVRFQSPNEKVEQRQLADECGAFWREVKAVLVRERNQILDERRRLRKAADAGQVRLRYGWLLVGIAGDAAVDEYESYMDLIDRARPIDLMTVYMQQPDAVRARARREAKDWQRFAETLAVAWRDAIYTGDLLMGYTTEFIGSFTVTPSLRPEHEAYLRTFSRTRRMKRDKGKAEQLPDAIRSLAGLPIGEEGGYFVGGQGYFGQMEDGSVIDYNRPPLGQPHLWCHWVPTVGGSNLEWNGAEKFSKYAEWLAYLIEHFLKPWGYAVTGAVEWKGEADGDIGVLTTYDGIVTAESSYSGPR